MAAAKSAVKTRTPRGRLRRALPLAAQAAGALVACGLWTGVASPSLKLLPGLDGLADDSIAISLQSAVLGIDDGSGRPAEERARDAAAVLGLTYGETLLSPAAVRAGAVVRQDGTFVPAVVQVGAFAAAACHARFEPFLGYSGARCGARRRACPGRPRRRRRAAVPARAGCAGGRAARGPCPPPPRSPHPFLRLLRRPRRLRCLPRRRSSSPPARRRMRSSAARTPSSRMPAPGCR